MPRAVGRAGCAHGCAAAKPTEAPKPTTAPAAASPAAAHAPARCRVTAAGARPPPLRRRPHRRLLPLPAAPASAPAAAAKPAAGTTVVTIRDHDWIQGTPGKEGDWYDKFIADWEKANPTIKIEREWFPRNEMHAKQLALAATGQIGDTVRINVAPTTPSCSSRRSLHDLDSLWKDDAEWMAKDQKQFWPGNIKTYTREGKVWGLPGRRPPGQRRLLHQQDDGREGRLEDAA